MKSQKFPREWATIHFKDYPRLDKIVLSRKFKSQMNIEDAFIRRASKRHFNGKSISVKEISKLLYYSCGINRQHKNIDLTRRTYPSAGARYPLEVYLAVISKGELNNGIYHYNVKGHCLEKVLEGDLLKDLKISMRNKENKNILDNAAILVIITSIPMRTEIKYKGLSDKFSLLEAGHMVQNLYLISESMGLGCCAIGGFDEENIKKLLDIDGANEKVIYLAVLGRI